MRIILLQFLTIFLYVNSGLSLNYTPTIGGLELDPQLEPDIERKIVETQRLVRNAAKYLATHTLTKACNEFIYNPMWRKGELSVFVFDQNGICLAHGDEKNLIWKNLSHIKGTGGDGSLIQEMLSMPGTGGTISYIWNNAYKSSFIQKVKKGNTTFIVGSGFYPESDEYICERLVKTAVTYFRQHGKDATFALINYPKGPFSKGDIYLFVYDFNGHVVAHGQNPALIGQNLIDQVDAKGKPLVKELIELAKTKGKGWIDYYWRNEFKRSYIERVIDPKTKKPYLIGAGYYPYINLQALERYVQRAISYIKIRGTKTALAEFSNQVGAFAKAGFGIFVFDFDGKCLANGQNPSFVGQNLLNLTDQDGHYYIKDMIQSLRRYERAFVTFHDYNARAIAYVERVDVPDGRFIVGATYYPDSKIQSTQTIVNEALKLLRETDTLQVFGLFSNPAGNFIRGDLSIFVYDTQGIRYVNGIHKDHLWQNMMGASERFGKSIISNLIATATQGKNWYEYHTNNALRRLYLKTIKKPLEDGQIKTFIIGSGYFM